MEMLQAEGSAGAKAKQCGWRSKMRSRGQGEAGRQAGRQGWAHPEPSRLE